jgi:ligand-binding sensor domain-containing protein/two-component sensor histidine kinase
MKRRSLNSVALITFLCTSFSLGQIKIFKNYGADEGLVQSHVFGMYEDLAGYLWLATYDGVSRWDGQSFVNFQKHDGLISEHVFVVYQGQDSTLYFGTDEGLSEFKDGVFTNLSEKDGLAGNRISALAESSDGILFIGTLGGGVSIYRQGQFHALNKQNGLSSNAVMDLHLTQDGLLYIATGNGINIYRNDSLSVLQDLPAGRYTDIFQSRDGSLYFGTSDKGVYQYRDGITSQITKKDGLADDHISSIRQGIDGAMYFGTFGSGVSVLSGGHFETLTKKNGLANDNVFCIQVSRDGTVFFGTVAGVSVYKSARIEIYNEDIGLCNNYVMSIYQRSDGTLLFGTFGGGLCFFKNGSFGSLTTKDGLANDHIHCIAEIDQSLLLGTSAGLSIYRNGRFTNLNRRDGLAGNSVRQIVQTKNGDIVLATFGGVSFLRQGEFDNLTDKQGLLDNHVNSILEHSSGSLYFATDSGVNIYRNGVLDTLKEMLHKSVSNIHEGRDGTLYFGTEDGLSILRKNEMQKLSVEDGLLHHSIYSVLEDDSGKIYLCTMHGVNILDFSGKSLIIRTLRHADGLSSDECSPNAFYKDHSGRLWFGSIRGASCYNPKNDPLSEIPPVVHIDRMRLFEQDIAISSHPQKLSFEHYQNYFKFDFVGINLGAPQKVLYRYQMSGVDPGWMETRQSFVQYTNMGSGNYSFEVQARNESEIWSDPAGITFRIKQAFWNTWWFWLVGLALVAGFTAYFISHRVRHLLAIERLRTRIAADLHDRIGSDLTAISIMSEVAANHYEKEAKDFLPTLNKISETARALVESMADIVWLVNPRQDSLYDLVLRLKESSEDLCSHSGINFTTDNLRKLQHVHLPMDYRQNLYMILKEAINNCLKHSKCHQIQLKTKVTSRKLEIILNDDGNGFEQQRSLWGNGLHNMKQRAQAIGGSIKISSLPGSGTNVHFVGKV